MSFSKCANYDVQFCLFARVNGFWCFGSWVLTLPEFAGRCFPIARHEKILLNVNKGNEVPRRGWEGWVGGRTPSNATTVTVAQHLHTMRACEMARASHTSKETIVRDTEWKTP